MRAATYRILSANLLEMAKIKDIETWYLKALDIPEKERRAFLETQLHGQTDLLKEVLELVQTKDEGLLTQLKNELSAEPDTEIKPEIDRYQLHEEIGRGGMAVVYRGERIDGVFDHEVAVKVLRLERSTDSFVQRFNQERNVLGKLKFENIAQIYDGGVTTDGRPYFVMELVSGKNLIEHAEENKLSLQKRLNLFLDACKAIRFAHQNLVIHQDIKPSNILVNNRGQIKLTDFGIAHLMDEEVEETSREKYEPIFTPGFASPEQVERQDIDTRTDIYQLGKVLKLLIGELNAPADLKLVVLHAIRKAKEERYQSVHDFIADIQNFLEKRPLSIRGGWGYRVGKYVQRHKVGVISGSIVALLLLISTTVYVVRINRANEQIRFEKNLAEGTVNLFLRIFSNAYPSYAQGDTLNVFQLLDIGDSLLQYSSNDLLSGRFSQLIGEIYAGYNRNAEALPYYRKAVNLLKKDSILLDDSRNMLFAAQASMVDVFTNLGQLDSAVFYLNESNKYAALNKREHLYRPGLYGRMAWLEVNRGNHLRADSLYRKAVKLWAKVESPLGLANQMAYYGRYLNYYDTPGRKDQIDSLYTAATKIFVETGLDSTRINDYARLVNFVGLFNLDIKSYDSAENRFQEAYDINRKIFGMNNLATLDNLNNLGQIMLLQERYSEAQEKFLTCWNAAKEINIPLGSSLVYFHNYASTFNLLEQYDDARPRFDSLVTLREKLPTQDLLRLNLARIELARSCMGMKDYDDAEQLLFQVKTTHMEQLGDVGNMDLRASIELVKLYRKMGLVEKAKETVEANQAMITARLGADSELISMNEEALN